MIESAKIWFLCAIYEEYKVYHNSLTLNKAYSTEILTLSGECVVCDWQNQYNHFAQNLILHNAALVNHKK